MYIALIFTLLRLILSPLLLAPLIALRAPLAITLCVYILLALTDFFDGYSARKYHQVTPLGSFLDQFADKIFLFSLILATVYTHQLSLPLALLLSFRELGVMGIREYGLQKNIHLPVIYTAKVKTAFQMILFAWIIVTSCDTSCCTAAQVLTGILVSITLGTSYYSAYVYLRKILA